MSRGHSTHSVTVFPTPGAAVSVEVRIGWVRCDRCERVFTAVGDRHDDVDDLKASAADSAEIEFDDEGREVCADCDAKTDEVWP